MGKVLSILLVDDDEDEYILLKDIVARLPGRDARYVLDWAGGYESALEAYRRKSYDLYLIDYYLGRRTGLEVMYALQEEGCNAPYILLTGQGSYELDLAAMQRGAADYLVKDQINEYLLERCIRYALERKSLFDELEERVAERTAALRQTEARFRTLADTTSAAIFIVQERKIRYANPAARFVTGYEPQELQAKELWEIAHPNYQTQLRSDRLGSQWAEDVPARYEIKIINKRGDERWLDVTSGRMSYEERPAWLLTAFDITDRDRAERDLRQAKDELEKRIAERIIQERKLEQQVQLALRDARQRAEELEGLQRVTSVLFSTLDLEHLFEQLLVAAHSALPDAGYGLLYLADRESAADKASGAGKDSAAGKDSGAGKNGRQVQVTLHLAASLGFDNQDKPPVGVVCAGGLPVRVVFEGRGLLIEDGEIPAEAGKSSEASCLEGMWLEGVMPRSWVAVPLQANGDDVVGVLVLCAMPAQAFNASSLRLLAGLATATSAALHSAMLYAQAREMALNDALTGIYNRRALLDLGQRACEAAQRGGYPLSVMILDLDKFKKINDSYGHAAGDRVLRKLVEHCQANLRVHGHANVHENDIFGRLGGDEFVILMPHTQLGTAVSIAERIRRVIYGQAFEGEQVSITVGVAELRSDHNNIETLLADADRALFNAKEHGRNRVEAFLDPKDMA